MTAGVPGGKTFGLNRKRVKIPHETVTVIAVGKPPQADSAFLQPIFSLHHTKISHLLTGHRDAPTGRLGAPSADIFSASHENITPAVRTPGCPHRQNHRHIPEHTVMCRIRNAAAAMPMPPVPPGRLVLYPSRQSGYLPRICDKAAETRLLSENQFQTDFTELSEFII